MKIVERLELSFHGLCRKYHLLRLLTQSKECWQIRDYSLFVELTFRLFEKRSFLCIFEIVLIVTNGVFFNLSCNFSILETCCKY